MSDRSISAEELDLLTFFEVEPTRLDQDVPWPYNEFLFEVTRGDFDVSFAITPAYRDVHLIVKRGADTLYELNAVGVDDVCYFKDSGGETLEIVFSAQDSLYLRLAPLVYLKQDTSNELTASS